MSAICKIVLAAIFLTGFEISVPTQAIASSPKEIMEDIPNPEAPNPKFASFSFKMDGVPLQGSIPGVIVIFNPAKGEVNIRGNTAKGLFAISINDVTGTGTYTIKGSSKSGAGIVMGQKMYEVKKVGTPFTLTIIAVDEIAAVHAPEAKAIRGTFQGKFRDNEGHIVEITDGKFSTQ